MRALFTLLLAAMTCIGGCASAHYNNVKTGTLQGRLIVEWYDRDKFVFLPDQNNRLRFTRSDGTVIRPEIMMTDGGSIPRVLWAFKSYSPWGYAPAFIIHDWLFVAHHDNHPDYNHYTLQEAGLVMSEVMKTMMEDDYNRRGAPRERFVLYSMYLAVTSAIARHWWDAGNQTTTTSTKTSTAARYISAEAVGPPHFRGSWVVEYDAPSDTR